MVFGGLWLYKNRERLWTEFRAEVHGVAETQLQDAVNEWIAALKYGDVDALSTMVNKGQVQKSDIPRILGHEGQTIQEIMEVEISEIKPSVDGSFATAYVDTKIRIPKAKSDTSSGMEAMAEALQAGKESKSVKRAKVSWKWVNEGGKWVYVNE